MGSWSGMRRQNLFSWLTVAWFSLAAHAAGPVGGAVELQTTPEVLRSRCGDNVTLTCEATVPPQMDIKRFSWVFENRTCHYHDPSPKPWCESAGEPPRRSLALTLVSVKPVDQGEYMCKLHSNMGVAQKRSVITVQECFGSVAPSINETHASCCFSGVYPAGVVHWVRDDINLTDSSHWQDQRDLDGRYNICSVVGVIKETTDMPFQCSLWIPSRQMYLASKNVSVGGGQEPSRRGGTLQGVLVALEMVVLKLVT